MLTLLGIILSFSILEGVVLTKLYSSSNPVVISSLPIQGQEDKKTFLTGCHEVNLLTKENLLEFGLDSTLAERWINFRNSIGGFQSMNQIERIFGISEEMIDHLRPVLSFEKPLESKSGGIEVADRKAPLDNIENQTQLYTSKKKEVSYVINSSIESQQNTISVIEPIYINTATEEAFMQIRGIGPVLSERIVRYRERLGGFFEVEQLKEVFGLDSTIVSENLHHFILDESDLRPIDLEHSAFREVLSHPYLEFEEVQCLFNTRAGRVGTPECISGCFESDKWPRVKPYLKGAGDKPITGI